MSKALSDLNSSSNVVVPDEKISSDLDLGFTIHPNLNDIRPLKDLEAIKQSVKNLVLTNQGDRPFQPSIGGNVTRLLFEPADPFIISELQEEIKAVIEREEPRVNHVAVRVDNRDDINSLHVAIQFNVVGKTLPASMDFYLERLR